ncbi:MAG: hypothetical protein GY870_20115 [archaeon]|nr:hypothetical protein [archaeon]
MNENKEENQREINVVEQQLDIFKFTICCTVLIVTLSIASSLISIPLEFTVFLGYGIISIFFSPIIVNSLAILFEKSWIPLFICVLGSLIGQWISAFLNDYGQDLPFVLFSAVFMSGSKVFIISWIKKKKSDRFALLISSFAEYFSYIFGGGFYYVFILSWTSLLSIAAIIAYTTLITFINSIFIPISLLLIKFVRAKLNIKYLDDLLKK